MRHPMPPSAGLRETLFPKNVEPYSPKGLENEKNNTI